MTRFVAFIFLGWVLLTNAHEFIWDTDAPPKIKKTSELTQSGLSVLWWNIQDGETNRYISEQQGIRNALDRNILTLLESDYAPDIFIFGEYSDNALEKSTVSRLKKHYPYFLKSFVPYNNEATEAGTMLFSRYQIKPFRKELMNYLPKGLASKCNATGARQYRQQWKEHSRTWLRYYLVYQIAFGKQLVYLAPVHLLEPWSALRDIHGRSLFAYLKVLVSLLCGQDNPLMNQVHCLKSRLRRDFGEALDQKPLLVIGDYNLTEKVYYCTTPFYREAQSGLVDSFKHSALSTWPAPSSPEATLWSQPTHRLDMSFHSEKLIDQVATMLPLKGSDHFPIYVKLRVAD